MTLERNLDGAKPEDFDRAFLAAADSMLGEHFATNHFSSAGGPRRPQGVVSARGVPPATKRPRVRWIARTFGRLRGKRD